MAKLLGIDFGLKRVGLAETDELQIIASPLTTIHSADLFKFILNYLEKNEVEKFILGYPTRTDGSDSHITQDVLKLKTKLENTFRKEVILMDERYTSKMAVDLMISSGMKKKKRQEKGMIDQMSATIILREYLEFRP